MQPKQPGPARLAPNPPVPLHFCSVHVESMTASRVSWHLSSFRNAGEPSTAREISIDSFIRSSVEAIFFDQGERLHMKLEHEGFSLQGMQDIRRRHLKDERRQYSKKDIGAFALSLLLIDRVVSTTDKVVRQELQVGNEISDCTVWKASQRRPQCPSPSEPPSFLLRSSQWRKTAQTEREFSGQHQMSPSSLSSQWREARGSAVSLARHCLSFFRCQSGDPAAFPSASVH